MYQDAFNREFTQAGRGVLCEEFMQIEKINGRRGYSSERDLRNSSHHWKAEFNNCSIFHSKYVIVKGKTDINTVIHKGHAWYYYSHKSRISYLA